MDEKRLEDLLYAIMQRTTVGAVAKHLGYPGASAFAKALKLQTVGTEELKYISEVLDMELSELWFTFFADEVNPEDTEGA